MVSSKQDIHSCPIFIRNRRIRLPAHYINIKINLVRIIGLLESIVYTMTHFLFSNHFIWLCKHSTFSPGLIFRNSNTNNDPNSIRCIISTLCFCPLCPAETSSANCDEILDWLMQVKILYLGIRIQMTNSTISQGPWQTTWLCVTHLQQVSLQVHLDTVGLNRKSMYYAKASQKDLHFRRTI